MAYEIAFQGESRSFPTGDAFLSGSQAGAEVLVLLGNEIDYQPARERTAVLVELGTECLGVHTGEDAGREGSNAVGFARYRNGDDPPSALVELVRQPATSQAALQAARAVFEAAGLEVAVCADQGWADHGAIIVVADLDQAPALVDRIAPEHLELAVDDPDALAARVRHAGAIFLGRHTPEAVGDYVAGTESRACRRRAKRPLCSSGLSVLRLS